VDGKLLMMESQIREIKLPLALVAHLHNETFSKHLRSFFFWSEVFFSGGLVRVVIIKKIGHDADSFKKRGSIHSLHIQVTQKQSYFIET
jgi:hypothetical protein